MHWQVPDLLSSGLRVDLKRTAHIQRYCTDRPQLSVLSLHLCYTIKDKIFSIQTVELDILDSCNLARFANSRIYFHLLDGLGAMKDNKTYHAICVSSICSGYPADKYVNLWTSISAFGITITTLMTRKGSLRQSIVEGLVTGASRSWIQAKITALSNCHSS